LRRAIFSFAFFCTPSSQDFIIRIKISGDSVCGTLHCRAFEIIYAQMSRLSTPLVLAAGTALDFRISAFFAAGRLFSVFTFCLNCLSTHQLLLQVGKSSLQKFNLPSQLHYPQPFSRPVH